MPAWAYCVPCQVLHKAAALGKPGLVEIKQRQDQFIFRVEGTGALPVRCHAVSATKLAWPDHLCCLPAPVRAL